MSEEKNSTGGQSNIRRIRLKRHLWPDEVQAKKEKRNKTLLKIGIVVMTVVGLVIGWMGGTILPIGGYTRARRDYGNLDSSNKIGSVLDTMANDWFFGADVEGLDERLVDQALVGISTNEEDLHTEYMSAEEVESFMQGINRDYVGIGVQFTQAGGVPVIERVFRNSPAEAAGLQAGDVFKVIAGTPVEGLSNTEIKELVLGDAGTDVVIDVLRDGEIITIPVTRGAVLNTAYGEMLNEDTIYLEILQFGSSTTTEAVSYLEPLLQDGKKDLIIDLRDNGGGYLTALTGMAGLFLDEGELAMQQVYRDGSVAEIRTAGGKLENIGDIVILINGNTASASEVLTMALKEKREGVTVVGTTSYGKGTVQVTKEFNDGSALKYTTSKWLSPSGVWVNKTGIEPDVEVFQHDAIYHIYSGIDEETSYQFDDVAAAVMDIQLILQYLDYDVDRTDGYFSHGTEEALMQFEEEHGLEADGVIDLNTYETAYGALTMEWTMNKDRDLQLKKAEEILHG